MTRWFVYDNATYYPSGEIVAAETPEEAVAMVGTRVKDGALVFPLSALVLDIGGCVALLERRLG
jgi:hypothetical protein